MAINRVLWQPSFPRDRIPGLPCPQCTNGKLKLTLGTLQIEEPTFSRSAHRHEDWEPDWNVYRFSASLRCDEEGCAEIVSVAGDTDLVSVYSDDPSGYEGWVYEEALQIRAVFPAPLLLRPPKDTPYKVKHQIRLASQLYWADLAASTGRLRTAVEEMLNNQKVPRDKVAKPGKTIRMDLAERIEVFATSVQGTESKDALHGLRYIGNLGTHGNSVSQEAFFDAVDVLEDVLLGIYEEKIN